MTDNPSPCLAESINNALHQLMASDESVVLIGQDIGRLGGVFRVTKELQDRFGATTAGVRDALLAESSIVGQAIGMSLSGLEPIYEIQFDGFISPAMNQSSHRPPRSRRDRNSEQALDLVIRVPRRAQDSCHQAHTQNLRRSSCFAHTPGLHIAFPSCPTRGLRPCLQYACRLRTPVCFFERTPSARSESMRSPQPAQPMCALGARTVRHRDEHSRRRLRGRARRCAPRCTSPRSNCGS